MAFLPVIDLNRFPDSSEYDKLRRASQEWGCFKIINHSVATELMAEMKRVVTSLLDLPMDIKKKNVGPVAGTGYIPPTEINPLYQTLGLYDFGSSEAVSTFCAQLNVSPEQREIVEKYAAAVYEVIVNVVLRLGESLKLERNFLEGWICFFRINKYSFTPESVGSSGVQLHTDSSFLTVLQADESVGGLEVMDPSGTFVPVDPSPASLLVNLGDMAKVWSNGRLRNVKHRVLCKEAMMRISIASFLLGPKEDAVEAPPEFVDEEHPRIYRPIKYGPYRELRLATEMQAGQALELMKL